jgi:hypothetical protein
LALSFSAFFWAALSTAGSTGSLIGTDWLLTGFVVIFEGIQAAGTGAQKFPG